MVIEGCEEEDMGVTKGNKQLVKTSQRMQLFGVKDVFCPTEVQFLTFGPLKIYR